ncbi:MAG: hypothetical protein MUC40_09195 [Akkermansiaceae bacterium]|nr:hypothetical protein [Akkermansiaceae bacterium]
MPNNAGIRDSRSRAGSPPETMAMPGDAGFVKQRTLTLAPIRSDILAGFYCGRIDTEPHAFLIEAETYDKLAAELPDE